MEKDEALIAGGIGAPKPLKIGNSAAYFPTEERMTDIRGWLRLKDMR